MNFNVDSQLRKLDLADTTFDTVDVDSFHNTDASTVFLFLYEWVLMVLAVVLLGTDIYTCLNILVFHHWSSSEYQPYAYKTAKWIFTACIIFQFVLLAYRFVWGTRMYRTRNIAFAYLNAIARCFYMLRSYNYHCFFTKIDHDNFFDWACFYTYYELDGALQILVADTPRQVINILTLRYYATGGDSNGDIIANIKFIAEKNLKLAVILGLICVSVVIWSLFCFKFVLGMILLPYVMTKIRKHGFKSLKKYNCLVLNKRIQVIVLRNQTKLRQQVNDHLYFGKKLPRAATAATAATFASSLTVNLLDKKEPFEERTYERTGKRTEKYTPPPDDKFGAGFARTLRTQPSALSLTPANPFELPFDAKRWRAPGIPNTTGGTGRNEDHKSRTMESLKKEMHKMGGRSETLGQGRETLGRETLGQGRETLGRETLGQGTSEMGQGRSEMGQGRPEMGQGRSETFGSLRGLYNTAYSGADPFSDRNESLMNTNENPFRDRNMSLSSLTYRTDNIEMGNLGADDAGNYVDSSRLEGSDHSLLDRPLMESKHSDSLLTYGPGENSGDVQTGGMEYSSGLGHSEGMEYSSGLGHSEGIQSGSNGIMKPAKTHTMDWRRPDEAVGLLDGQKSQEDAPYPIRGVSMYAEQEYQDYHR